MWKYAALTHARMQRGEGGSKLSAAAALGSHQGLRRLASSRVRAFAACGRTEGDGVVELVGDRAALGSKLLRELAEAARNTEERSVGDGMRSWGAVRTATERGAQASNPEVERARGEARTAA